MLLGNRKNRIRATVLGLLIVIVLIILYIFINNKISIVENKSTARNKNCLKKLLPFPPVTLDPAIANDVSAGHIMHQIYDRLFAYDSNGNVEPSLLKFFKLYSDKKTYEFCLREKITFHDGSIMTSDDVIFSFLRVYNLQLERARQVTDKFLFSNIFNTTGIKKISEKCFTIKLKTSYPPFISDLSNYTFSILPKHLLLEKGDKYFKKPIGSGAYILNKINDKQIELIANKDYFLGKPNIYKVEYIINENKLEKKEDIDNFLITNDIDDSFPLNYTFKDIPPNYRRYTYKQFQTTFLGFNISLPPFDNIYVRKAFLHFFDRNTYNKEMNIKKSDKAFYYLPYGSLGYIKNSSSAYDPIIGYKLLRKAGVEHPKDLGDITIYSTFKRNYLSDSSVSFSKFKNIIESIYHKFGFRIKMQLITGNEFVDLVTTNKAKAYIIAAVNQTTNPTVLLEIFLPSYPEKLFGIKNSKITKLLEKSQFIEDRITRNQIFQKINKIVYEEYYAIYLNYLSTSSDIIKNDIILPQISLTGPFCIDLRLVDFKNSKIN